MTQQKTDAGPEGAPPAHGSAGGVSAFPDFLSELTSGGAPRSVLILQGLATPFFRLLAKRLTARGHRAHRINFCPGDWLFGPLFGGFRGECTSFRGRMDELDAFYRRMIATHEADTILLFGDCRPVHTVAVRVAKELGVRVLVFEEGYTRPGWVTMEEDGTNSFSRLPHDAAGIHALADAQNITGPIPDVPVATDMTRRALMDVANHAVNIFFSRLLFPHYRGHRSVPLSTEAKGWARRLFLRNGKAENTATLARYETNTPDFFLVPLQLNTDYQIRVHSDYPDMPTFIRELMASFAGHAPEGTRLFFKNHPLDNGTLPYRQIIRDEAAKLGIGDRVDFASGGDLNHFLKKCRGVVLVNSTVGYATLKAGRPLKAMGRALYDMPGLTDQRPLHAFWAAPTPPEHSLAQAFLGVIQTYTQLRGDFFSAAGADIAVNGAVDVIEGTRPRLPAQGAPTPKH